MKAKEAIFHYYINRHALYDIRANGGSGTKREKRVANKLVRLRRHLDQDGGTRGGLDITVQIDAQVVEDRAKGKVLKLDAFSS